MSKPSCPHCRKGLMPFELPDNTGWQTDFHVACFNDDCSYYTDGWEWMREQYNQNASYRYAFNPSTKSSLLIPVWSDQATRENIVPDEEGDTP